MNRWCIWDLGMRNLLHKFQLVFFTFIIFTIKLILSIMTVWPWKVYAGECFCPSLSVFYTIFRDVHVVLLAKWLVSLTSDREVPGSIPTGSRFFCAVTRGTGYSWPGMRVKCILYTVGYIILGRNARLYSDVKLKYLYLYLLWMCGTSCWLCGNM